MLECHHRLLIQSHSQRLYNSNIVHSPSLINYYGQPGCAFDVL
jgi:hypothetical protein